jgi:hypothetical protein
MKIDFEVEQAMKTTLMRIFCLLLPMAVPVGCGKPSAVAKALTDAAAEAGTADMAAPETPPPAPPEQKCLAENYKLEAARRWKEVQLEPLFIEAGLHARLAALLGAVTEAAAGRKFDTLPGKVTKIWEEMKRFRTATSDSDLEMMKNIVKIRVGAYASCMAIASRDASWCARPETLSQDFGPTCNGGYVYLVIIGKEAIGKGKSCEEAAGNFHAYPRDEILAVCRAIKDQKPALCPEGETTPPGILCRAAATRATTHICENIASDRHERDVSCCELFSWRFANIVSGIADPYIIPEAGALSGDKKGCMRGLAWGLMEDLGPLFGFDAPKDAASTPENNLFGDYLCPMIVQWSQREPPL